MPPARPPLSRDRVVAEAMALADERGLAALSMRALAGRLGVEAMSLYHHVAGKEALLDAMVDAVFGELHLPVVGGRLARRAAGEVGLGARRAAAPPLGRRADGLAAHPGPAEPASPRRRAGLPCVAGVLAGRRRHGLRPARRPPLRLHAAGGEPAVRRRGRPRRDGRRAARPGGARRLPALHRLRRGPRPAARLRVRRRVRGVARPRARRARPRCGRPGSSTRARPAPAGAAHPRCSRSACPCWASTAARAAGSAPCSCRAPRGHASWSRPTIAALVETVRADVDIAGRRHRHPDRVAGQHDPPGRRARPACRSPAGRARCSPRSPGPPTSRPTARRRMPSTAA